MSTKVKNALKVAVPVILVAALLWYIFNKKESIKTTSESVPTSGNPSLSDEKIKKALSAFVNDNTKKSRTWQSAIQGHLNWLKDPVVAADPSHNFKAVYAQSINYDPVKATADAVRLGLI